jgi:NADH dehydrogenase
MTLHDKRIPGKQRIVIIGAGFAGIHLAKNLAKTNTEVILVDKNNYHCFQPLLYQVATAGLETGTISYPIRRLLQKYKGVRFLWGEVTAVDTDLQQLHLKTPAADEILSYDKLVIAIGTTTNFFNFESIAYQFMTLKSIPDALNLRSYILQNLELAVMEDSEEKRAELLNIAIVGGGPTGVELAGAIAEMKKHVLPKDYPELDINRMQINLFQRSERILDSMHPKLSEKALQYLEKMGVNVHLNTTVTGYDGDSLILNGQDKFATDTVIWAAGVKSVPPMGLDKAMILPSGRIQVDEYLKVLGYENIYALGDIAYLPCEEYPRGHPQVAPVAISMATSFAKNIKLLAKGKPKQAYQYKNKGSMAVVGRNRAVVELPNMRSTGFLAWLIWMFVHLLSLVGFRNKVAAFFTWAYSYFSYEKALRLIVRRYERKQEKIEIDKPR